MDKSIRIVILASGVGSNAYHLIQAARKYPRWKIVGVICDNPHAPILTKGKSWGVPLFLLSQRKEKFSSFVEKKIDFEKRLVEILKKWNVQWVCLAGFMRILSAEFLHLFYDKKLKANRVLNIHPSLLPEFPGKEAYRDAFDAGVVESGVTVHFVEENVDAGPIILQKKFPRLPDDNLKEFIKRGKKLEHELYAKALEILLEKEHKATVRVLIEKRQKEKKTKLSFYTIHSPWMPSRELASRLDYWRDALCDPVLQKLHFNKKEIRFSQKPSYVAELTFRPGVTDNSAQAAQEALSFLGFRGKVASGCLYFFFDPMDIKQAISLAHKELANPLIQQIDVKSFDDFSFDDFFANPSLPKIERKEKNIVENLSLEIPDEKLEALSKERCLALNLAEMKHIRRYFRSQKDRSPTDVELEIIAQTWSEHCKHKIFNACVDYQENAAKEYYRLGNKNIDGLFKTFIKGVTKKIIQKRELCWGISLFHDNAGIVRFDDCVDWAIKMETHNSPSALDPYGGALTGILGVNRDILGCGLGARPIANLDIFCLPFPTRISPEEELLMPAGVPLAKNLLAGVHRGIEDGGNRSGIPTVGGAFFF